MAKPRSNYLRLLGLTLFLVGLGCRRLVATGSSFRFLDDKSA